MLFKLLRRSMSDKRKHDSPKNTYHNICSRVLKLSRNKINPSGKSPKQTQSSLYVGKSPHTRFKADVQTPKRQARSRYTGLNNNADSPGDGDVLQDIIWDPTSPTPRSGKAKVIEISDIVNRIAPKDAKPVSVDSSLLQWIGDSAVPCTPEESLPRARRTLKRKSSVEDLMHLARQFDINMQQGLEEHGTERNNNSRLCGEEPSRPVTMTTGASSARQVEAELNALFDGPTQRISGRFSQASSTCSSEGKDVVRVPAVGGQAAGSEVKRSGGETTDDKVVGGAIGTATPPTNQDFDTDWADDDLLSDPFVLEITQNPAVLEKSSGGPSGTLPSVGDNALTGRLPPTPAHPAWKGTRPPTLSGGGLAGPRPEAKLPRRSTFTLEPNPCFQGTMSHAKERSPAPQPGHPDGPRPGTTTAERTGGPRGDSSGGGADGFGVAPRPTTDSAFQEIPDDDLRSLFNSELLWSDDQGGDDELLCRVCDDVERLSNSQTGSSRGVAGSGSGPLTTGTYCRSNSEPGKRGNARVNFQGWNIPAKSGNVSVGHQSLVSCSRSGSAEVLDKFTQIRGASGWGTAGQGPLEIRNFQAGNTKTVMPRTVSARTLANPNNSHTSMFKRHLSDSAVCNKVFVPSQGTGRCTAAEIERKKQEAIARRKSRQTSLKSVVPPQ